jgi:hypothetical protein
MTYKFNQFKVEITDPTVEINLNSIQDKAIDKLLSVDIILSTTTATFGVKAEDMSYVDSWEDTDISSMVNTWLVQFEV